MRRWELESRDALDEDDGGFDDPRFDGELDVGIAGREGDAVGVVVAVDSLVRSPGLGRVFDAVAIEVLQAPPRGGGISRRPR